MLTIQGKLSNKAIMAIKNPHANSNEVWLFVDYASIEIPVGNQFDAMLKGEYKELVPFESKIKLLQVIDQFGHSLNAIPQGWKTICKFGFSNGVPVAVKSLKELNSWSYNPSSISFALHEEVKLNNSSDFEYDLLIMALNGIRSSVDQSKHNLRVIDFFAYLKHLSAAEENRVLSIINKWEQLGIVKRGQNEEVEFSDK